MRAVLWCNGNVPSKKLIEEVIGKDSEVFGVDGGADKAKTAGVELAGVLGDMDSLEESDWDVEIFRIPDQSKNDLSKSIDYLIGLGYEIIDIIGVEGGVIEHFLGNWAALAECLSGSEIRVHNERSLIERVNPGEKGVSLELTEGEEFSVFALEPCRVTILGAKWELNNEEMALSTRGLHNQSVGGISVIKADGVLVVITNRKL